jgi:DNA-binding IclR family transcriptional regulator
MTDAAPKDRYIVPALQQGLSLLALFTRERPSLTAPEIASELKLSRATVFRMLHTLQHCGYLVKREDERAFSLGPAILSRGFVYLAAQDIAEIARPILQKLRDETGLSAHMAVRDGREVVYIARFSAQTTVNSTVQIGSRFPVHATVMGRMMICEWDDKAIDRLFPEETLPAFSEQTPKTRTALKAILKEDRQRGYAVSQSFFERGVSSAAAPVHNSDGRVVATINVTSVDNFIDPDTMTGRMKDAVLAASAEIGRWLSRPDMVEGAGL